MVGAMAEGGVLHRIRIWLRDALRSGAEELDPARSDPRVIAPEPVTDATEEEVETPHHVPGHREDERE